MPQALDVLDGWRARNSSERIAARTDGCIVSLRAALAAAAVASSAAEEREAAGRLHAATDELLPALERERQSLRHQPDALADLHATAAVLKRRAFEVVRGTRWRYHRGEAGLDLNTIAPFGQKDGFEKVVKLIDDIQIDTTE